MRLVFIFGLFALPIVAKAQFHEEPINTNVPYELTPLDSLIHYPEEALEGHVEGKVETEGFVVGDGSVDEVKIINSSNPVFNEEAIRVFRSVRFEHDLQSKFPPVRMLISRTITFDLNNKRSLIALSKNDQEHDKRYLTGWSKSLGYAFNWVPVTRDRIICTTTKFTQAELQGLAPTKLDKRIHPDSLMHHP